MAKYFIGLMSGTSMDAVDAVLVDLSSLRPHIISTTSTSIPYDLKERLLKLNLEQFIELSELAKADYQIAKLSADTVYHLIKKTTITIKDIIAIGSHGQTIYHQPKADPPSSIQIGDPNLIAEQTQITTVADFRRRDIACGGEGAPLVPAFHRHFFHSKKEIRTIVNIGGMANITALSTNLNAPIKGFDTGPGNVLMDYWCQQQQNKSYDENGDWASSGQINHNLLESFLNDPYFTTPPPKSTGRELFNENWLNKKIKTNPLLAPEDIQATLCELTAQSITHAIEHYAPETQQTIICGGGVHNKVLMERLHTLNPHPVSSSEDFGIHPDWVEAVAFAWLAQQTIHRQPGNLPSSTGASHPAILGGVYYA
ncbi:Anhydro-N-acetylmuramic acid kinase [hydrothermal vent metagenome]|uniref:Anhydro-N-acetylmuramic acid kinase n=1 Tax=hydrothermal vent metagenome TaxID=652676 RepID=A0A3B0Z755_9ZZZZ